MDKGKGCVLLLINAGVRSSVSERTQSLEFRHFRPHYLDVNTIFGD
jgi:hypothetical protein